MELIDGVLGNVNDDEAVARRVHDHDSAGTLERVTIEAGERRRSRLRVETDAGTDLGVVPDRELRPGDVLVLEQDRAVVVEFESREAAVIPLPEATRESLVQMSKLGHRIGNQHWDLAVHDGRLYVPVAADRHIVEDVLGPHIPRDAEISYADVDAGLWIDGHADRSEHDHSHQDHEHATGRMERTHFGEDDRDRKSHRGETDE